jgi:hypothetical protein
MSWARSDDPNNGRKLLDSVVGRRIKVLRVSLPELQFVATTWPLARHTREERGILGLGSAKVVFLTRFGRKCCGCK